MWSSQASAPSASQETLPFSNAAAQLGLQYTLNQASSFLPQNSLTQKLFSLQWLRSYFNVTHSSALTKLSLLAFPFPKSFWKAPQPSVIEELYVPSMALLTYAFLGSLLGVQKGFHPESIWLYGTSGFVVSAAATFFNRISIYALSSEVAPSILTLYSIAATGFVPAVATMAIGHFMGSLARWAVFGYGVVANSLYVARSLRSPYSYSVMGGGETRKKVYFLLVVALIQSVFSYLLLLISGK